MADISTNISNLAADLRDFRTKLTAAGISVSSTAGFRECVDNLTLGDNPDLNFNEVGFNAIPLAPAAYVKSTSYEYGILDLSNTEHDSTYQFRSVVNAYGDNNTGTDVSMTISNSINSYIKEDVLYYYRQLDGGPIVINYEIKESLNNTEKGSGTLVDASDGAYFFKYIKEDTINPPRLDLYSNSGEYIKRVDLEVFISPAWGNSYDTFEVVFYGAFGIGACCLPKSAATGIFYKNYVGYYLDPITNDPIPTGFNYVSSKDAIYMTDGDYDNYTNICYPIVTPYSSDGSLWDFPIYVLPNHFSTGDKPLYIEDSV